MADILSKNLAVFVDYQNFAFSETFNVKLLLDTLAEKGRLVIKRAYADWGAHGKSKHKLLENSFDLIEVPTHTHNKNSADIRLVLDALEIALTRSHIDTFVVVSGDSDYIPLISRLREYNKYVIVIGEKASTSRLLAGFCDELLYYSSLCGATPTSERDIAEAFALMRRALIVLTDRGTAIECSQVKSYMRQLDAAFDEKHYGVPRFHDFLRRAEASGYVRLLPSGHGHLTVHLVEAIRDIPVLPAPCVPSPLPQAVSPPLGSDAFALLRCALFDLITEDKELTGGYLALQVKRRTPDFAPKQHGFRQFKHLLEAAQSQGFLTLERTASGDYRVLELRGHFAPQNPSEETSRNVSLSE